MMNSKFIKFVPLLMFSLPGAICMYFGVPMALELLPLARDVVEIQGTVVSNSQEEGQSATTYYPVVEFVLNGKKARFKNDAGANDKPAYEVGSVVTVVHTKREPVIARVGTHKEIWETPLFLSLFGLLFVVCGIAAFFFLRNFDREFDNAEEKMLKERGEFEQRMKEMQTEEPKRAEKSH